MSIRIQDKQIYLSVRDLITFRPNSAAMLSPFPLPHRGMLGKKAQDKIQQIRSNARGIFHREVSLRHSFTYLEYTFTIYGRIDGVLDLGKRIEVEEIKSVLIDPTEFKNIPVEEFPDFTEQIVIYCYLLHFEKKDSQLIPVLRLYNLLDDKIRSFYPAFQPRQAEQIILERCKHIINGNEQAKARIKINQKKLRALNFQLSENRPQQKEMMHTVSEILEEKECLLISAPTGTGKTAAVLYPAIKFAVNKGKRIVYLTAKNTQHSIIEKTIKFLTDQGLKLSTSMLRANRTMCANDIFFCHRDYCIYAENYQHELKRNELLDSLSSVDILTSDSVYKQSKKANICPAQIMFELTKTADILVADYNYLFSHRSRLDIFLNESLENWILIVDEVHNLPQRVNDTLSPKLSRRTLLDLGGFLLNKRLKVYRSLNTTIKKIDRLFENLQQEGESSYPSQQYFTLQPDINSWREAFREYESVYIAYVLFKARKKMIILDDPIESFYYRFREFINIAGMEEKSFTAYFNADNGGTIGIHCADSSDYISMLLEKFHSVIAMSATLDPIDYYLKVLGFTEMRTKTKQFSSPFLNQNRLIVIIPSVSTYFNDRMMLYPRYARIVEDIIATHPGNYILFGPSFEFIQALRLFLGKVKHTLIMQKAKMTRKEREAIVSELSEKNNPTVLLAVMGGIFSEGIDFSAPSCQGLIIFSPAIPKITFERELSRDYFENKWGNGFNYAYLYPGMNKVIQAAGRIIRNQQDRGIIVLAGERFARDEINQLFPSYWFENPGDVIVTEDYKQYIREFWKRFE